MPLTDIEVDLIERVLRVVDKRQLRRVPVRDLTGQLTPDRAAGPGDHHPPALDQGADRRLIQNRLRPAKEILDRIGRGDSEPESLPPALSARSNVVSLGSRPIPMPSASALSIRSAMTEPSMAERVMISRSGAKPRRARRAAMSSSSPRCQAP